MTIAQKLEAFAINKFGNIKALAMALGTKPASFYKYLGDSPRSEPGAKILKKLKAVGCDINWLLSEDEAELNDTGPPDVDKLQLKAENDRLEEENRLLRGKLSQITLLTQAVEMKKKDRRKKV